MIAVAALNILVRSERPPDVQDLGGGTILYFMMSVF